MARFARRRSTDDSFASWAEPHIRRHQTPVYVLCAYVIWSRRRSRVESAIIIKLIRYTYIYIYIYIYIICEGVLRAALLQRFLEAARLAPAPREFRRSCVITVQNILVGISTCPLFRAPS